MSIGGNPPQRMIVHDHGHHRRCRGSNPCDRADGLEEPAARSSVGLAGPAPVRTIPIGARRDLSVKRALTDLVARLDTASGGGAETVISRCALSPSSRCQGPTTAT
jgi:hypothetical protein